MTIMQQEATSPVRCWMFELDGNDRYRGTCDCGWVGPEWSHASMTYTDWELHQESTHAPEPTSCPEWCDGPSRHGWTIDDPGRWSRFHKRHFGPVTIERCEYLSDGCVTFGPTTIETGGFGIDDAGANEADELAADLTAAAEFLRGLQQVAA